MLKTVNFFIDLFLFGQEMFPAFVADQSLLSSERGQPLIRIILS